MTILLFLIVLVVLIVVHEFGHLVMAKIFSMRVDEFGIGYPPRALTFYKKGSTIYTLNWLPFGGFVKIFGEDDSVAGVPSPSSFVAKPRYQQALVLIAGIAMNIVFAWMLLSLSLALGATRVLSTDEIPTVSDARVVVSRVLETSPAAAAGLQPGDTIVRAKTGSFVFDNKSAEAFTSFIAAGVEGTPIHLLVLRDGQSLGIQAVPKVGIVPSDPQRLALGVGVATVGTVVVPWWQAPFEGVVITAQVTAHIAQGLIHFFAGLVTLSADISQVAGPVGIVGAVGDASASGFVALLTLTAIISINLALVNLLPVPALDGGRLLFVLIEAIIRKPIPQGVAATANSIGFGLLILLMLIITANDIGKLF